ncbi:MAG: SMC-Scp complex subunit ScpB [Candidatus Heimdallarchaeota archaeon]
MDQRLPVTDEQKQILKLKNQQLVEAALYLAGRPVQINELAQVTSVEPAEIGSLIKDLQEKYSQFFSSFEIIELPGRKFVFQVRADVGESVKEITLQPLLTIAELRTLAMIAYQQPILQSTVAKVRGQQSYLHIKNLLRNGFVKSVRVKQTLELRTTSTFSDYFGLSEDVGVLKRQLGWRTKRIIKDKKMEPRDSRSINDFMTQIGMGVDSTPETLEVSEGDVPIDQDSARDLFSNMFDSTVEEEPTTEQPEEDEIKED